MILLVACVGALYPFTIYPALLHLLTRNQSGTAPSPGTASLPFSIIIPAHNEEGVIAEKIENTLAAIRDYPAGAEIIVAADGCTDRTCDIVRRFGDRVTLVLVQQRSGIVGALKAGVAHARHEVVFFSDADILVAPGSYQLMMRHLEDACVGGVCGTTRLEVTPGSGLEGERANIVLGRWIRIKQSQHVSCVGADGANWGLRKSLVRWPANPQLAEDLVMPLEVVRLGYRYVCEPDAWVVERTANAVADEYYRKVRTIAGGIQAGIYCRWMFRRPFLRIGFHYLSWKIGKYLVGVWLTVGALAIFVLSHDTALFLPLVVMACVVATFATVGMARLRFSTAREGGMPEMVWYGLVTLFAPIAAVGELLTRRATVLWRIAPRQVKGVQSET